MRTVFNNDMCAHVWAQLKQPHGRSGSMRFDGAVAYSYAQPVAHLIKPYGKDKHVALFTARKWSVTTSAHITDYRRAASQYDQFTVPNIFAYDAWRVRDEQSTAETHAENLKYFRAEFETARDGLMRAPADSWRLRQFVAHERYGDNPPEPRFPTNAHETLHGCAWRCDAYCAAFGIETPEWAQGTNWKADADKVIARRDRLLNDPKRAAKIAAREKARAAKEARERAAAEAARIAHLAECAEIIAQWRAGADVRLPWGATTAADTSAMLRIRGDIVQTSLGAEAPLDHVRRVLRFYDYVRSRGESTSNTQHEARANVTLGHFTLNSIDAQGNVRAGCHFITAREIEDFRALLIARDYGNPPEL